MFTVFTGGSIGPWLVEAVHQIRGDGLPPAARLVVEPCPTIPPRGDPWSLVGVPSYVRYVHRNEKEQLTARQASLGRPEATRAALIPIAKTEEWWDLTQDERRSIFEERSRHIAASMKYLPAIARKLYQSRELGEPFDFLTWFEFAPEHSAMFDELVAMLRATEEWRYVRREVDVRLVKDA